ncbi:MAG: DUF1491 family protein [Proteobacteria bacterium]|nr:DUF1491 family protein [Pseudomonadota bacterium]MBW3617155.1 DUF1491 family protein [Pseudomonadota bacterium]
MLLPSEFWVQALIRRAEAGGAYAAVLRRGDARAGAVLVKVVNRREGWARLYAEALRGGGETGWMEPVASKEEAVLDAYAERAWSRDPDVWIVEVDDSKGRHFLTEPVERREG